MGSIRSILVIPIKNWAAKSFNTKEQHYICIILSGLSNFLIWIMSKQFPLSHLCADNIFPLKPTISHSFSPSILTFYSQCSCQFLKFAWIRAEWALLYNFCSVWIGQHEMSTLPQKQGSGTPKYTYVEEDIFSLLFQDRPDFFAFFLHTQHWGSNRWVFSGILILEWRNLGSHRLVKH